MKTHIYLIPYAGADISCFDRLREELTARLGGDAEVIPVELRGHGKRHKEPLYADMNEAADDILSFIGNVSGPVILYGHCIGGIMAYEVYRKNAESGALDIRHIVLGSSVINKAESSGFESCIGSYVEENLRLMFPAMPDGIIRQLSGYKKSVVAQEYSIVRAYLEKNDISSDSNQTLLFGNDDSLADICTIRNDYPQLSSAEAVVIKGGHFFLDTSYRETADIIIRKLNESVAES